MIELTLEVETLENKKRGRTDKVFEKKGKIWETPSLSRKRVLYILHFLELTPIL